MISSGLEKSLYTVASRPASANALPASDQGARPTQSLQTCWKHASGKLSIDWPHEPCESQSSKLDERCRVA